MKHKGCHVTLAYGLLQMACWSFSPVLVMFSSNVLYDFGFQGGQVSMLLGCVMACSFFLQLAVAELVARNRNLKVWGIMVGLGIAELVSNFLLWLPESPRWLAIASFAVGCLMLQLLAPFANAVAMEAIKRGSPTNYGIGRGMGSLGYSSMGYLTGRLVQNFGSHVVPLIAMCCGLLLIGSMIWYHTVGEKGLPEPVVRQQEKVKKGSFLRLYPRFGLFLLGSLILLAGLMMPGQFMYQIMLSKGGTAAEQGTAIAICAMVEIPTMFCFPLIMHRMRCDILVRFSSMFIAVKNLGFLLASSPRGIYLAETTQMLGFALYTMSAVNYAESVVDRDESVRAQSYLGATTIAGSLLASSSGGFLCQYVGPQAMICVALAENIIGGIIILLSVQKPRKRR